MEEETDVSLLHCLRSADSKAWNIDPRPLGELGLVSAVGEMLLFDNGRE